MRYFTLLLLFLSFDLYAQTPPPGATAPVGVLKEKARCTPYVDASATSPLQTHYQLLQGASCPTNTGCFESTADELITPGNSETLTTAQEDELDDVNDKLSDTAGMKIGDTCGWPARTFQHSSHYYANPPYNDVRSKLDTAFPNRSIIDRPEDVFCMSLDCSATTNKCVESKICRCAKNDEAAPTGDYCCPGHLFDDANKVCKDFGSIFRSAVFIPPPPPTQANGCNINFPSNNPSREIYVVSSAIMRSFEILTSFDRDGGDRQFRLFNFLENYGHDGGSNDDLFMMYQGYNNGYEGATQYLTKTRKEIIREYKSLKDFLEQKKEQLLNDTSKKAKAQLAAGTVIFDVMTAEQEIVRQYELALRDMLDNWYAAGLNSNQIAALATENHNDPSYGPAMEKCYRGDLPLRGNTSGASLKRMNHLCFLQTWRHHAHKDDGHERECNKENIWVILSWAGVNPHKWNNRCFKRMLKVRNGGHYNPGLADYLMIHPLNHLNEWRNYRLYDLWIPNLKKVSSSLDNRVVWDDHNPVMWGNKKIAENLAGDRKKAMEGNQGSNFYELTKATVIQYLKNMHGLDNEYVDFELGILKSCLDDPVKMDQESCNGTRLWIKNISEIVFSMNHAWAFGMTQSDQDRVLEKGSRRQALLELVQQAYVYSSSYLDGVAQLRRDRISCLLDMKDARIAEFSGGLDLEAGNYQDQGTGTVQASQQARNNNYRYKQYNAFLPGVPGSINMGLNSEGNSSTISSRLFGSAGVDGFGSSHAAILNKSASEKAMKNPALKAAFDKLNPGAEIASVVTKNKDAISTLMSGSMSGGSLNGSGSGQNALAALSPSAIAGGAGKLSDDKKDEKNKLGNGVDAAGYQNGAGGANSGLGNLWGESSSGNSQYGNNGDGSGSNGSGNDLSVSGSMLNDTEKESILANLKKSQYQDKEGDTLFDKISKNYVLYAYPRLLSRKQLPTQNLDKKNAPEMKDDKKANLLDGLKNFGN
ncbi:MAG: hypothetical protein JNM93_06030 [Bacteriovoracaceae bacterium]|nr:hypothetical protein [Bacteriovoracaceae bacterium]